MKEREIKEKEEAEKIIQKQHIKVALKEWDAYKGINKIINFEIDRLKLVEYARKREKEDKIKRLEKAQRFMRKNDDEIL